MGEAEAGSQAVWEDIPSKSKDTTWRSTLPSLRFFDFCLLRL